MCVHLFDVQVLPKLIPFKDAIQTGYHVTSSVTFNITNSETLHDVRTVSDTPTNQVASYPTGSLSQQPSIEGEIRQYRVDELFQACLTMDEIVKCG